MQTRLALRFLDWGLRKETGKGFREWVEQRRPSGSDEKMPWYRVAGELSALTGVDVAPETVRRWYEK